jgi:predicted transposase YbfD/YdcC
MSFSQRTYPVGCNALAFDEDNSRKRAGFAAQNYFVLNRIALNLFKNEKTTKVRVRGKRL